MGEISDMMLDGDLCEGCGEYMEGGEGYPRRCSSCMPKREPKKKYLLKSKDHMSKSKIIAPKDSGLFESLGAHLKMDGKQLSLSSSGNGSHAIFHKQFGYVGRLIELGDGKNGRNQSEANAEHDHRSDEETRDRSDRNARQDHNQRSILAAEGRVPEGSL